MTYTSETMTAENPCHEQWEKNLNSKRSISIDQCSTMPLEHESTTCSYMILCGNERVEKNNHGTSIILEL